MTILHGAVNEQEEKKKKKTHQSFTLIMSRVAAAPADSHRRSVNGRLGGQSKEQREGAGRGQGVVVVVEVGWEGCRVTTNLLRLTDTKEKGERTGGGVRGKEEEEEERESDTTPAILFLRRAATVFVTMATQADDLIAVAFECSSLKEADGQTRTDRLWRGQKKKKNNPTEFIQQIAHFKAQLH